MFAFQAHPDPTGEQLKHLLPLLKAIVAECDKVGPNYSWGMLWDYMSLPQRGRTTGFVDDERDENGKVTKSNDDRTPPQIQRFSSGLGAPLSAPPSPLPVGRPLSAACIRILGVNIIFILLYIYM